MGVSFAGPDLLLEREALLHTGAQQQGLAVERSRHLRPLGEGERRLGEAECERPGGEGDVELALVDL